MCDVCVAGRALWTTKCRDKTCKSYEDGEVVRWDDAPRIKLVAHPAYSFMRSRHLRRRRKKTALVSAPGICVRATGSGAEFKPAKYQMKLEGQKWPKEWFKTKDLALVMCRYGLDTRWKFVPKLVQAWVLGGKMPSMAALERQLPKEKSWDRAAVTVRVSGSRKTFIVLGK